MHQQLSPPVLVDKNDGATLLGISPNGFLNLVKRGVLPDPIYLGRRRLWEVRALLGAVKKHQLNGGGA
jgi:hypothetical protein